MTWRAGSFPKIVISLLLYLLTLITTLILFGCSDNPSWSTKDAPPQPKPGIVFTSDRTGNWDLFLIQADGSELIQLTDSPKVDADPAWSTDGTLIAFRSRRDGSSDIFVMESDGTNQLNLINDPELSMDDEFAPHWNPDRETLSIYTDRFPPRGNCLGGYHQIAMLVQEAQGYEIDLFDTIAGEQYSSTWSPDGRFLVFNSACGKTGFQLYIYDTQTGDTNQITREPVSHSHPAFSHDGRRLAFAKHVDGDNEIFLLYLDTMEQIQLTDHPANDTMPSWSPDDSKIAFVSNREGNRDIFIMKSDGSNLQNLTNHPADDWYPSWSPIKFSP